MSTRDEKAGESVAGSNWFGFDQLRLSDDDAAVLVTIGSTERWDKSHLRRLRQSADLPGLVPVVDADAASDGKPYAVTPVVDTESLADRLPPSSSEWADCAAITEAAARATHEAHLRGLFHGALSPEQIYVLDDDVAVGGVGLGLGGVPSADDERWVAPEVRDGNDATERSDVYSLGKILEASLGQSIDDVPRSVRRLIMWSSSDTPEARPPSALEFASILAEAMGEDRKIYSPAFIPTAEITDLASTASEAVAAHVPTGGSASGALPAAAAGVGLGAAAAAGALLGSDHEPPVELDEPTADAPEGEDAPTDDAELGTETGDVDTDDTDHETHVERARRVRVPVLGAVGASRSRRRPPVETALERDDLRALAEAESEPERVLVGFGPRVDEEHSPESFGCEARERGRAPLADRELHGVRLEVHRLGLLAQALQDGGVAVAQDAGGMAPVEIEELAAVLRPEARSEAGDDLDVEAPVDRQFHGALGSIHAHILHHLRIFIKSPPCSLDRVRPQSRRRATGLTGEKRSMFDWMSSSEGWIALGTLTAMEVVLGIDNIVFISILASRLPGAQRTKARNLGLLAAMLGRLVLLGTLSWIMRLKEPLGLFTSIGLDVSGRDLIMLIGGGFLLAKATLEIHHKIEGPDDKDAKDGAVVSFRSVIIQIILLDVVFSLDSVITAVGMTKFMGVMVTAVVISVAIMMLAAKSISSFIERHPTVKMLALSFLLLIGVTLIAEGLHFHIPKGYIYFAMAFSVLVESLNLVVKGKTKKVAKA